MPQFFKHFGPRVGQDIALQMWLRVVKQLGQQVVMEKFIQRQLAKLVYQWRLR